MNIIRKIAVTVALAAFCFSAAAAPEPDYSGLTAQNHPRLFFTAADFKAIPKALKKKTNPNFSALSEQMIEMADSPKIGQSTSRLVYKKDGSGRRILGVSRNAIRRIVSNAYAYRVTKDKKYLDHAEADLNDVCDFPDWNPSHFLDTGEMSLAVAIGYDWLYEFLNPITKDKVETKLKEFGIDAFMKRCKGYWHGTNNWNQVCNAGITAACLAVYELWPDECRFIIEEVPKSNLVSVDFCYNPDGAYPEGPGYWEYGTTFQTILNTELEFTIGTDFGLSDNEGFRKTGYYNLHTQDSNRKAFNYSDGHENVGARSALWYFARKFNNPGLLYTEKYYLEHHGYVGDRQLFCALANAWKCNFDEIPAPKENMYFGQGVTPVAFFRTGWDKDDLRFGIKAGKGTNPHAHLDAGTFVFTGWGVRWACDAGQPSYSLCESYFQKRGKGNLWDMKPGSDRWNILCYNNYSHNTLTVNDKKFDVTASSSLDSYVNTPERMGATVTMTPVFGGDLKKAVRSAAIVNGEYLEITDELEAPEDRPAHVRWSFLTKTIVTVGEEGITLQYKDKKVQLKAEGADVVYKRYPLNEDNVGLASEHVLKLMNDKTLCGFEFDIPAGGSVKLLTTLVKR